MNIYKEQDSNKFKTYALMCGFLIFIIFVGWGFSYIYADPLILYIAVIFSIVMNITSFWYSDKIVLSLYKAQPVTNDSHPDLYNMTENIAITAGLPMPHLFVIPDTQPNAFATGRNPEHAAIAVTSGLLAVLDKTELEGVIAHEMAHIGNRDTLLQTVIVILVGFIALLADIFIRMQIFGGRDRDNKGGNVLMLIGIVLAILSPLVATLIQLAVSRKREFLADSTGALFTRYPEGLASALEKISASPTPMKRASNATAHLFISNPFGQKSKKGIAHWFSTHPPVEERIAKLRGEVIAH